MLFFQISESPSEIMESLTVMYNIPKDKQTLLFTHIRLAHGFSNHKKRLQAVQARLHAISILGKREGRSVCCLNIVQKRL